MTTRTWKVYGAEGHRQRESFRPSDSFRDYNGIAFVVENSDKTGTNEYTIVKVTAENADACHDALLAQIDDGIFENSKVGRVEEVLS